MAIDKKEYIQKILSSRVYEVALETALDFAPRLSARFDNDIFIKREDLQPVHSFKLRGAYNKIAFLPEEKRKCGVIAASAGNHAQGVALAAKHFGCPAMIVMPTTTPDIKVEAVKSYGAAVVLHGDSYSDCEQYAHKLAEEKMLTFVHPFNDPDVIAGQGTIAVEIFKQCQPPPDYIFVCVGGGGLLSGIALYAKAFFPKTKIIGVEHNETPTMHRALAKGEPVSLEQVSVFADGAAVRQVGNETFRICSELVDQVILCSTDEICAAVKDAFEDSRAILEPAGALALSGAKKYLATHKISRKRVVAIASGANVNFTRLRYVAERADIGEDREALFVVSILEKPGSFKSFISHLGNRSITEFNYRYANPGNAQVLVGIAIKNPGERGEIVNSLQSANLSVVDITEDEIAKTHIRHMVGGKAENVNNERIFHFQFPERPGALSHFLKSMQPDWNISLFHYRNHGADIGRVLVGIQVPENESKLFESFLEDLDYQYLEVSNNPACAAFL